MTDWANRIHQGDALEVLHMMPGSLVHCVITSPPYWGLRDYKVDGQVGLEGTPEEYVVKMVEVFREVRRVLRDDGTLWLNIGDSYATNRSYQVTDSKHIDVGNTKGAAVPVGLKPKDLLMMPARVALALQADGWWLRSDIVWSKPNPMPESVSDRPTRSHEYIFLLAKSARYHYDANAIKEPGSQATISRLSQDSFVTQNGGPKDTKTGNRSHRKVLENLKRKINKQRGHSRRHAGFNDLWDHMTKEEQCALMRNKRSVWTIPVHPFHEAHFATFPEKLVEPCILAGCPEGGIVLDPFMGAGTTALVAVKARRDFIGIELNPEYIEIAGHRLKSEMEQGRLL